MLRYHTRWTGRNNAIF